MSIYKFGHYSTAKKRDSVHNKLYVQNILYKSKEDSERLIHNKVDEVDKSINECLNKIKIEIPKLRSDINLYNNTIFGKLEENNISIEKILQESKNYLYADRNSENNELR